MSRKELKNNIAYDEESESIMLRSIMGSTGNGKRVKKTKTYRYPCGCGRSPADFRNEKRRKEITIPTELTVGMWLDRWLDDVGRPNRARVPQAYGYEKYH